MILKGLKERLKNRYNIALIEEDYTNLWQRSRLSLVSIADEKQTVAKIFDRILDEVEKNGSVQILSSGAEYF